jgi:hypothetical protein
MTYHQKPTPTLAAKQLFALFAGLKSLKPQQLALKEQPIRPCMGKPGLSNFTFPLSVSISQEKALTFTHCPFRLAVTIHSVFVRFVSKAT